ncbi:MAG: hypothetical protein HYV39_04240, partial [Candidatus Levybacteria bacterium]|nr:hypothetical protein [Candidatus Levybacteria bacterium]
KNFDRKAAKEAFEELGFKSLVKRLEGKEPEESIKIKATSTRKNTDGQLGLL